VQCSLSDCSPICIQLAMGNASSSANGEVVDSAPRPNRPDGLGQPARFDVTPLTSALKAVRSAGELRIDDFGRP